METGEKSSLQFNLKIFFLWTVIILLYNYARIYSAKFQDSFCIIVKRPDEILVRKKKNLNPAMRFEGSSFINRYLRTISKSFSTNEISTSHNIISGVSALIVRGWSLEDPNQAEYLLVQRGKEPSYKKWSFPGGKVEYGETLLEAIKREITEELHLYDQDVRLTKFPFMNTNAFWNSKNPITSNQFIIHQFYGILREVKENPVKLFADDDIMDYKWKTKEQISQMINSNQTVGELIKVIQISEKLRPYLLNLMEIPT